MIKKNKPSLTLEQRSALTGHLFITPFYLGFLFFFLTSLVKSIYYVFCDVSFDVTGVLTEFSGLENLNYIFNKDLNFKINLGAALGELAWRTPVVLIMSLILAMLANIKTKARPLIRSVFFLPVVLSSGVVLDTIREDGVARLMMSGTVISATGEVMHNSSLNTLLVETGLNPELVTFFSNIASNIFEVMFNCGIPMLIFIAALQGISPSLYEASAVEGATAWDNFWKITFPMITPNILINLVYIIVDSFSSSGQAVMKQIMAATELLRLGHASAMVWVFCVIIVLIFAVLFAIFTRLKIFEQN